MFICLATLGLRFQAARVDIYAQHRTLRLLFQNGANRLCKQCILLVGQLLAMGFEFRQIKHFETGIRVFAAF